MQRFAVTAGNRPVPRQQGFSLIELAMVLMIVGALMSGLLVALGQTAENARRTDARADMAKIIEALYGFAQVQGRLPCPATPTSAGQEDINAPEDEGECVLQHGFVPNATLGLYAGLNQDGLLNDPWGNPYRYSVSDRRVGANRFFTSAAGAEELFNTPILIAPHADFLTVCDTSDCSGRVFAETVPALVFSMGKNWAAYDSANEVQNAGTQLDEVDGYRLKPAGNNEFVDTEYSEDEFDDILVWLSPYTFFNKLVSAGQLP